MGITKLIQACDSFKKDGDAHQSILDIAYAEWQRRDGWDYADMIDWLAETYGDLPMFAVLAGKYNQQVCNGGHTQYFDNGYADGKGGCFQDHDPEGPLHQELVLMMEKFGLQDQPVYAIMKEFRVDLDEDRYVEEHVDCDDCEGTGMALSPDDNEEDEEESDCYSCTGRGYNDEEVSNEEYGTVTNDFELGKLDSRYYEVNDDWMKFLESFIRTNLEVGCSV